MKLINLNQKMSTIEQVPFAKALLGAVFIQYVAYGVIYIIEGAQYQKLYEGETKAK